MANPGMRHAFKSAKSDPVDTTLVGATKWNDRHYFLEDDGTTPSGALGDLAYRGVDGLTTLLSGAQGVLFSAGSGNVPANTMTPVLTSVSVTNTGLKALDTNASHYLTIAPGSDLTDNRTLTITTGDAARTVTLSGNPTLADWFDQAVKAASSPTFAAITIGAVAISDTDIAKIDDITNGTGAAGKALVLDSNTDITTGVRTFAAENILAPGAANLALQAPSGSAILMQIAGTTRASLNATTFRVKTNIDYTDDNSNDLGAVAANRPRTGYFGTSVVAPAFQTTTALVALGGGSAPTLGTIGGSGPATAAQNTWLRMLDSTGAAFWVPAWK